MRNPENVLNSLSKHSGNLNYKFERLYRVLFNEEMFYVAYQNIYSKTGNMTAGADGKTIPKGRTYLRKTGKNVRLAYPLLMISWYRK